MKKPLAARACRLWATAALVLAVGTTPRTAFAQSAYVPLDDVAYAYIDALLARGELRSLSLLDRPYTVQAIRAATEARGTNRALYERLRRALAKYDISGPRRVPVRAELNASVWATSETSSQRELMLANETSGTYFGGAARFLLVAGPVVGFARPILENRLNDDPDFRGRTDRSIAGRNEDAYVSGQWRYAELFFGRMARNWGPHALQGLLVSDAPFTYDQLFGKVGNQRIDVSLLLARLDDDTTADGLAIQRYLATHRLRLRWRGLEAALAESFVYAGVGRGFEPALANPFSVYAITWRNEQQAGNLAGSAQVAARTRFGILSGELLLDDVQIDRCETLCEQPASYGFTLSAEGVPFILGQRAFASYARVSALAYRNKNFADRYTVADVSIGRAFADYDEFRIGMDVLAAAAPVRGYFAFRRQGQGDYRAPFPPPEEYAAQPGIFEGIVTKIARVGVSGGVVAGELDVRGDIGYNWVDNPDNSLALQPGFAFRPRASAFEGRVRLSWTPRWAGIRFAP